MENIFDYCVPTVRAGTVTVFALNRKRTDRKDSVYGLSVFKSGQTDAAAIQSVRRLTLPQFLQQLGKRRK